MKQLLFITIIFSLFSCKNDEEIIFPVQKTVANGNVINASNWSSGVYFVKIGDGRCVKVVKY